MSFDQRRGVTVVYTAWQYRWAEFPSETWEWDGESWNQRPGEGPGPRSFATMTYDPRRGVTVLFGGNAYPETLHDTWEWDGEVWTLRTDDGPEGLDHPRLVFDERRGRSILFGVRRPDYPESTACETWGWDGENWMLIDSIMPCPIYSLEGLAYDQRRGVVVMLGQSFNDEKTWEETWEWDGSTWQVRDVQVDEYYESHERELTYDARRGVTVASGGSQWATQTQEWDGSTWTVRELDAPGPIRRWHALAYDQRRGVTVLFGGLGRSNVAKEHPRSDTWEYDGRGWELRANDPPGLCGGSTFAYDRNRNVIIAADWWSIWEIQGNQWKEIGFQEPWFQSIGTIVFDERRSVTVHLGIEYESGGNTTLVVREWNGEIWNCHNAFTTSPNGLLAVAYDTRRGETLVFAYMDSWGPGSLWSWNGNEWRLKSIGGPPEPTTVSMTYDRIRDRIVLLANEPWPYGNTKEVWEWNGDEWISVPTSDLSPLTGFGLIYDEARGVSVLRAPSPVFREFSGDWEWDGIAWKRHDYGGLEYSGDTMVFDWSKNRLVLFGANCGYGGPVTWELRPWVGVSDMDSDCDTDLADFAAYQNCVSGEGDAAACREAGIGSDSVAAWMYLKEFLAWRDGPSNGVP